MSLDNNDEGVWRVAEIQSCSQFDIRALWGRCDPLPHVSGRADESLRSEMFGVRLFAMSSIACRMPGWRNGEAPAMVRKADHIRISRPIATSARVLRSLVCFGLTTASLHQAHRTAVGERPLMSLIEAYRHTIRGSNAGCE